MSENLGQPLAAPTVSTPAPEAVSDPRAHAVPKISSPLPVLGAKLLSQDLYTIETIEADAKLIQALRQRRGGDLGGLRFRLIQVPFASLADSVKLKAEDYLTEGDGIAFSEVVRLADAYRQKQSVHPLVARYLTHDQRFELLDGNKRLSAIATANLDSIELYELLDGTADAANDSEHIGALDPSLSETPATALAKPAAKKTPLSFLMALSVVSGLALALIVHALVQVPIGAGIALPLPFLPTALTPLAGVVFWTLICLAATASPISLPKGAIITSANPVIVGAAILGGPLAALIVAGLGTLEMREIKHQIPIKITLENHLVFMIPAYLVAVIYGALVPLVGSNTFVAFLLVLACALLFFALNLVMVATGISLYTSRSLRRIIFVDAAEVYPAHFILAPIAWLMSFVYVAAGWWAVLITVVPLFTTRLAHKRLIEMKETFLATIKALTHAMEVRDFFTAGHSHRVSEVAVDIGRALDLNESEIEMLEWAGTLHDIGKIGVPDAVLMKPGRLTDAEMEIIRAHPVLGALIVRPIKMLSPEVPLIRHHHEWFNGTGYPDKLAGEEIPFLSRVLAVADSFDAMTSQRPYRMKPMTPAEAVAELRKGCGTQFDPQMVAAFEKTQWATVDDPRRYVGEDLNTSDLASAAARFARGMASIIGE